MPGKTYHRSPTMETASATKPKGISERTERLCYYGMIGICHTPYPHIEDHATMAKRISALDATLRALGGEMGEWNGMDLPYAYPSGPHLEHNAVRDAVGIWDTSCLLYTSDAADE